MINESGDYPRTGLNQSGRGTRADENSNWRTREKQRLNRFV